MEADHRAARRRRRRIEEARESARSTLDELLRMARRLRPEALEDLGQRSALTSLAVRVVAQNGIAVVRDIEQDLSSLIPDAEPAIDRIAKKARTNAMRSAGAERTELQLRRTDAACRLHLEGPTGCASSWS